MNKNKNNPLFREVPEKEVLIHLIHLPGVFNKSPFNKNDTIFNTFNSYFLAAAEASIAKWPASKSLPPNPPPAATSNNNKQF